MLVFSVGEVSQETGLPCPVSGVVSGYQVGGNRDPGSFDFLGACLATVVPGELGIPQQGK